MSYLISRILLTVFMLPLAAVTYTSLFVLIERLNLFRYPRGEVKCFLATGAIVWLLIATYWLLLWGRSILWTPWRLHMTWVVAVASAGLAGAVGLMLSQVAYLDSLAAFVGSAFAPMFWLVGTVLVWRESKAERAGRVGRASQETVVCPACGYNLTGLSDARCPECGAKYTLNELFAAQPERKEVAAEAEIAK